MYIEYNLPWLDTHGGSCEILDVDSLLTVILYGNEMGVDCRPRTNNYGNRSIKKYHHTSAKGHIHVCTSVLYMYMTYG